MQLWLSCTSVSSRIFGTVLWFQRRYSSVFLAINARRRFIFSDGKVTWCLTTEHVHNLVMPGSILVLLRASLCHWTHHPAFMLKAMPCSIVIKLMSSQKRVSDGYSSALPPAAMTNRHGCCTHVVSFIYLILWMGFSSFRLYVIELLCVSMIELGCITSSKHAVASGSMLPPPLLCHKSTKNALLVLIRLTSWEPPPIRNGIHGSEISW